MREERDDEFVFLGLTPERRSPPPDETRAGASMIRCETKQSGDSAESVHLLLPIFERRDVIQGFEQHKSELCFKKVRLQSGRTSRGPAHQAIGSTRLAAPGDV